jgi:hypothetical protein
MHKSATKCNETIGKWCKNKHGASKIIDTFETYHVCIGFSVYRRAAAVILPGRVSGRDSVTVLYIFCFRLLDVKRIIDSLCVCSFHFILLIIIVDEGVVKVMDSKRTPLKKWTNMQECLQKAWKRFTANTRGVWKPELTFQPLNVSTTC